MSIPGFTERNRPEKPLTQLTISQLKSELRRFPTRGLTPQMQRRVAALTAELASRSAAARETRKVSR